MASPPSQGSPAADVPPTKRAPSALSLVEGEREGKRVKTWVMTSVFMIVLGVGLEFGALAASLFWTPVWTYLVFSLSALSFAALMFLPLLYRKSKLQKLLILLTAGVWVFTIIFSGLYLGHEARIWYDAKEQRVYTGSLVSLKEARRLHADYSPSYSGFCFNGTTYFGKEYAQEVIVDQDGGKKVQPRYYCTLPLFMSSSRPPEERIAVLGYVGCTSSCTECINSKQSHTCGVRVESGSPSNALSQELDAYLSGTQKIQSASGLVPAEPPVFYHMQSDLPNEGTLYDALQWRFIVVTVVCWTSVIVAMVFTGWLLRKGVTKK